MTGEKLSIEDLRRLGLLSTESERRRDLLEEIRVKDMDELAQIRRDGLVRQFILGGAKGRIVVDGETLDLETEARELSRE